RYWTKSGNPDLTIESVRQQIYRTYRSLFAEDEESVEQENENDYDGFENHGRHGAMNEDDIAETLFPVTKSNVGIGLSRFSIQELLDNELKEYINLVVDAKVDYLIWWQDHKNKMPKLALIANRFLSAPPSSVESERLFSIG
ncbi:unnamed protein product, partial [Meganyctiphanes norvegica]